MKSYRIIDCDNFRGNAIDDRKECIKSKRLKVYNVKDCKLKYRCHMGYCNKRHHSLINSEKEIKSKQNVTEEIPNDSITCNKIYGRDKHNKL